MIVYYRTGNSKEENGHWHFPKLSRLGCVFGNNFVPEIYDSCEKITFQGPPNLGAPLCNLMPPNWPIRYTPHPIPHTPHPIPLTVPHPLVREPRQHLHPTAYRAALTARHVSRP